jgi:3-hydroxyisobutyrate dehydrogenase
VVFAIVSTGKDVEHVLLGKDGLCTGNKLPRMVVDCSSISVEESAAICKRLSEKGMSFLASPVSGNAKVIKAGKLSAVASGPEAAAKTALPLIEVFAPQGVSYVGEGELARICKIAHNVMLGVVIENLIEIMLLANKMGVPRHAFLAFMNNGVMGSMFTKYKKAEQRLRTKMQKMTPPNWGRSVTSCMKSVSRYLTGWISHFRLCTPEAVQGLGVLDAHIGRRRHRR